MHANRILEHKPIKHLHTQEVYAYASRVEVLVGRVLRKAFPK